MSAAFMKERVSRSIAWRLAAGVLPSVLAVGLVAGLFYYGVAGRTAPRLILILASALTLTSVIIAWANATYFAERLARLARATDHAGSGEGRTDEFDRIERAVGNLGSALSAAEEERVRSGAAAAAQLHDQATMLAGVVNDSLSQLDEVRLPLQILLESPFGELNENQEELLRDARAAADAIDVALRRLAQVADIDRDEFPVQHEPVQVNDVVRSVLPLARAAVERRGARTVVELEPGLPRVVADRARLAEALTLLVTDAAASTGQTVPLTISTARDGVRAIIRIAPASPLARSSAQNERAMESNESPPSAGTAALLFAARLVAALGGELAIDGDLLTLRVGQR